ncbi:hypothetical protein [Rhizobium sp. JAB6]|uniref:hypothetical protein n=1 Tax=Rhizobium sp. JAB6 TaxID=2127050 RepID=UPI001FE23ED2|nr:hypothetical protein [Rhizobium sp. JAB6]
MTGIGLVDHHGGDNLPERPDKLGRWFCPLLSDNLRQAFNVLPKTGNRLRLKLNDVRRLFDGFEDSLLGVPLFAQRRQQCNAFLFADQFLCHHADDLGYLCLCFLKEAGGARAITQRGAAQFLLLFLISLNVGLDIFRV